MFLRVNDQLFEVWVPNRLRRVWSKMKNSARKYVNCVSHVEFLEKCLKAGVTPKGMCINLNHWGFSDRQIDGGKISLETTGVKKKLGIEKSKIDRIRNYINFDWNYLFENLSIFVKHLFEAAWHIWFEKIKLENNFGKEKKLLDLGIVSKN